jgi:hypothetical protein
MHVAPPKAAKLCALRLPNGLIFGSLWHFSKLQPFREKNRHPLERGLLGTLRQKWGFKREYIYYISITYSKAAKLGIVSWHPLELGTLSKLGIFPLRLPNCLRLPNFLTPPHPSRKNFSRPVVAPARPGSPARLSLTNRVESRGKAGALHVWPRAAAVASSAAGRTCVAEKATAPI